MLIPLIIAFVLIIIIDYYSILRSKARKLYIVYFLLLSIGFVINLLLIMDKAPISPAVIIERMVKSII